MKGFNMSKIKHMRKNQGFSEIKFHDNASLTACLGDPYIFRTNTQIHIDYFFQLI